MKELELPQHNGQRVFHGAVIDFNLIALEHVPLVYIRRWLNVRTYNTSMDMEDLLLIEMARQLISEGDTKDIHSKWMLNYEIDIVQPPEETPFRWLSAQALLDFLRDEHFSGIPIITDEDIDHVRAFGEYKNGIRFRAQILVQNGHYDKFSIAQGRVKKSFAVAAGEGLASVVYNGTTGLTDVVENEDGAAGGEEVSGYEPCSVFTCVCAPSMKSGVYAVQIVFSKGKYIPFPGSRCKCPDGKDFCSHMLGCLIWMSIFQRNMSDDEITTWEDFKSYLPNTIRSILAQAIPFSYFYS